MLKFTIELLFTIGIGSLIYFSWIPIPDLSREWYIPAWLGIWSNEYETFRTAVPMFFTGIIAGIWLMITYRPVRNWIFTWILLSAFVLFAEYGQLFLSKRIFDWMDIYWGICGSFTGLSLSYLFLKIILNYKSGESK